ncbi:MAG: hypothetical protein IJ560_03860 [Alphaproteobacteria bacterium]|nr:hypothetical protein [Alphaproteobacteria bacterium]
MALADFTSCGPGYIYASRAKIDGIDAAECQKLWCRDLETNTNMGTGDTPARGYRMTDSPGQLCDATGRCVECWGERVWCRGQPVGAWNAEYGAYTRDGADNSTYQSYQNGTCFSWRLGRPNCESGTVAIEDPRTHEWVCTTQNTDVSGATIKASTIRRTGTIRRTFPR